MTTRWECERCGASGELVHGRHVDVWTVAQDILNKHVNTSPHCLGGRNDIRCQLPRTETRVHDDVSRGTESDGSGANRN